MQTQLLQITVSPSIGAVSAKYLAPEQPVCILTLAHGAGAGMDHVFMETLAAALADSGIATLRFNFPFAEHNKRRPDTPAVAQLTIEAALAKAQTLQPKLPLFLAGKSFGGRMSSQYLAAHATTAAKGIIFFGFPLHPAGKPAIDRAEHLHAIKVPMLFLQGTRDALATLALLEGVCASLPKATLVTFAGADHSFKAGKQDVLSWLVAETGHWVKKILQ